MKYKLIEREVMNRTLDSIYSYPYTVITAPMGYGKSTAVKEYLENNKKKYIWLPVSMKQTSASYIWEKFIIEVKNKNKELGIKLTDLGLPEREEEILKAIDIIKKHISDEEITLVIDDYHLVYYEAVDKFLVSLVMEGINNLHIVVIGRSDPSTNTHELMVKGICNKIEQNKFEFSKEDIVRYFEANECVLLDETIDDIYKYTEGWIAAVYLIMMEIMKFGDFKRENTLDKLIESTVFSKYDKEVQDLLLKLAVVDSYTVEQAIYITESKKIAEVLWDLADNNSFLKYDFLSRTYKAHSILNSFLIGKLKRSPHINEQALVERAGEWYMNKGDIMLGSSYLIKSNNYSRILEELSKIDLLKYMYRYFGVLDEILDKIPEEIKLKYPKVVISQVYWLLIVKHDIKGYKILNTMEEYYGENYNKDSSYYKDILGEIYLVRAMTSKDSEEFSRHMRVVKENISSTSKILYIESTVNFSQPLITLTLHKRIENYKPINYSISQDMKCLIKALNGDDSYMEELIKAEYYIETMDFKSALICAKEAIYEGKLTNKHSTIIAGSLVVLRINLYNNDLSECDKIFEELKEISIKNEIVKKYLILEICKSYIYSRSNNIEKISSQVINVEEFRATKKYTLYSICYVTECDVLLLQGKYIELGVTANNYNKYACNHGYYLGIIYSLTYRAISKYNLYGLEDAKIDLIEALKLAQEDNIIMSIAEQARHILDILYSIQKDNIIESEYMEKLIFHSEKYYSNVQGNKKKYNSIKESVNLLTKREREVLVLMALGKSNRQIGTELFISEYTVKTTLSNIYKKTGVRGRVEAIKLLD